ncbi:hypothetical protein [Flaviaesturariibacter terrae]
MKKLFLLLALAVGVSSTSLHAQEQQRDPQQMAQRIKERMKPQLIERTHITDAQAEQVMDLYIAQRQEMRGLRDMSQEDRQQKMSELNQKLEKSLLSVPLTVEQIGSVMRFFEEQRQQARQNRANGGGGQ